MSKTFSPTPSRVLALDPGFERLGVAVLESGTRERVLWSECFRTPRISFAERLSRLGTRLEELIEKFSPTAVALEALYFNKNQKTAMDVAAVRGVILYVASSNDLPTYEYTPSTIKAAVAGSGRAGKKDIAGMVKRLVHMPKARVLDDEYDAVAVGLTHLAFTRTNVLSTRSKK